MSKTLETFLAASELKTFDIAHRETIKYNVKQYNTKVLEGKEQFSNLELAKDRLAATKHKSIENLEKHLIAFEANRKRSAPDYSKSKCKNYC
jgi:L-lactate dehydrogenase complex protein LldF